MVFKSFVAAAVATVMAVGSASAAQPASFELRLRGQVPVICRATVEASVSQQQRGVIQLGQLKEFCNNATGYEVWVDYSPNLSGTTLMVDGQAVRLHGNHSVLISMSSHAAVQSRDIALTLPGNRQANGSLSFRVVPV